MKKTQGRKKIPIQKIEDVSGRLQVTFSKRRAGLFNKAAELCLLSGSEVAIFVESPGHRIYSFGCPSVNDVMNRYLTNLNSQAPVQEKPGFEPDQATQGLKEQCSRMEKELDEEKKKKKKIAEGDDEEFQESAFWWDMPIDGLEGTDIVEYIEAMEKLLHNVETRIKQLQDTRGDDGQESNPGSS